MRHGTPQRRQRNRGNSGNNGRRGSQQRMQVYDSNGPDVRIRGTAHQVHEKYTILAKDAASSGDRVLAESYLQHAEHYQRIMGSWEDSGSDRTDKNQVAYDSSEAEVVSAKADLSLPASILGGTANVESAQVSADRTPELTAS